MSEVAAQTEEAQESEMVQSADNMDDETFCMHFNRRHRDDLNGLDHLWPLDRVLPAWRSFHRRIHDIRVNDFDHEHRGPPPQ